MALRCLIPRRLISFHFAVSIARPFFPSGLLARIGKADAVIASSGMLFRNLRR